MCDPYNGLSILLHGVILLPDATSDDKRKYLDQRSQTNTEILEHRQTNTHIEKKE